MVPLSSMVLPALFPKLSTLNLQLSALLKRKFAYLALSSVLSLFLRCFSILPRDQSDYEWNIDDKNQYEKSYREGLGPPSLFIFYNLLWEDWVYLQPVYQESDKDVE